MATVAELLRRGREARGLSVRQVADTTKMRTDHVRALEEGDYNAFIAPVYIRGFVRTYAALLKLDVPAVLACLDTELAQTEKFREPPSLMQEPPSTLDLIVLRLSLVNWRVVLPLALVLLVGLISLWVVKVRQNHLNKDPLTGVVGPGLYQPTQKPAGEVLPLPAAAPAKK